MESVDRVIGKLEESHSSLNRRLDVIDNRFDKLELKVDKVLAWKLKIVGGGIVTSAIVAGVFEVFQMWGKL